VREEGCLPGGHLAAKLGEGKRGKPGEGRLIDSLSGATWDGS